MVAHRVTAAQVGADRIARLSTGSLPSKATGEFLHDTHLLAGSMGHPDAVDLSNGRLASMLARRMANQHGCRAWARCWDRNHRRDAAYLALMLGVLGLDGAPPQCTTDDYALPGTRHAR
jgi:hypothetical protein